MTLAEIIAELGANETILNGVLEHVGTLPKGQEMLNNYAKAKSEEFIAPRIGEIYTGIDTTVAGVLGISKPHNMKTSDFVKSIATELKELKDKAPTGDENAQAKIAQLEQELAQAKQSANGVEELRNKLATETSNWAAKSKEYTDKIAELEGTSLGSLVKSDLASGLQGLSFNTNIPESVTKVMIQQIEADVLKTAKVIDGKPVYHNADGTPMLNGLYQPISAKEIFATKLADIIKTDAGGGAAEKGGKGIVIIGAGDTAIKKLALEQSKITSKIAFANHFEETALANGIAKDSDDFQKMKDLAYTDYGVKDLPRGEI